MNITPAFMGMSGKPQSQWPRFGKNTPETQETGTDKSTQQKEIKEEPKMSYEDFYQMYLAAGNSEDAAKGRAQNRINERIFRTGSPY